MTQNALNAITLPLTGEDATFKLSQHQGKIVVLYFYPKDATPGCTIEAQEFRDLLPQFTKANCAVFGVSRDSLGSHEKFREKEALNFQLISDKDELLCQHFGLIKEKIMYGKPARGLVRSTFVFDQTGALCHEWREVKPEGHAAEVLAFVQTLAKP